jgi:putative chitinase
VYSNREGNGNGGDGFRFRGGGIFQNTFRNSYLLSKDTRIDFIGNPDLITVEANAVIAALEYWKNNNLNKYADLDDLDAISDIIDIVLRKVGMQTVMRTEKICRPMEKY